MWTITNVFLLHNIMFPNLVINLLKEKRNELMSNLIKGAMVTVSLVLVNKVTGILSFYQSYIMVRNLTTTIMNSG